MSRISLFDLPEKLLLIVTEYLSNNSLYAFMRTSKTAYRIAHQLLYIPRYSLHKAFEWAIDNKQEDTALLSLPGLLPFLNDDKIPFPNSFFSILTLGQKMLDMAIRKGCTQVVRALLDHGVQKGSSCPDAPFKVAAANNQNEILNFFLAEGADPSRLTYGEIFSPGAMVQGHFKDTAPTLARLGLKFDEVDGQGNTLLHHDYSLQ
ncbi:hypothetical protein BJY04DRAFT_221656 [Aspergillus karnatakaensis]|uniref:uncharacterized protein n=1 Tax=Aspergillus karnatakaensis TaxID=1810916 RepID=UPI003CCE40EF